MKKNKQKIVIVGYHAHSSNPVALVEESIPNKEKVIETFNDAAISTESLNESLRKLKHSNFTHKSKFHK